MTQKHGHDTGAVRLTLLDIKNAFHNSKTVMLPFLRRDCVAMIKTSPNLFMPAKAGIQKLLINWIPDRALLVRNDEN